jgi:hypothetical protein
MKVTKRQLKQIIKEELEAVIDERFTQPAQAKDMTASGPMGPKQKANQDRHQALKNAASNEADFAANSTKENCQQLSAASRKAWSSIETDSSAHTMFQSHEEDMKKYKCKQKFGIE